MTTRFSRLAIPATLFTFAHCGSSTGPSDLTGSWRTTASPGSRIELSLRGALHGITGTGQQFIVESLFDSLTVDGRWNDDGTFHLTLDFANTTPATYDGAFVGSNQLVGTLTRNGQSGDLAFYRQAQ